MTSKNTNDWLGDQGSTDSETKAASSRPFYDAVVQDLESCRNKQIGENGMPEYTDHGIGSSILALNQLVRGGTVDTLVQQVLARNQTLELVDLFVLLFSTRNARGGKGEKKLAYDMFLHVWKQYPATSGELLPLFAHYGYWKDLLLLLVQVKNDGEASSPSKTSFKKLVLSIMAEKLMADMNKLKEYKVKLQDADAVSTDGTTDATTALRRSGPGISLLSKWLPREGSSLDKKIDFVGPFSAMLWPQSKSSIAKENHGEQHSSSWQSTAKARYRREVAEMTSYLALPEVLLAAQREDEIEFGRVASKATLRLRKVFLNEDASGDQRSENPKRIRLAQKFLEHTIHKGLKGKQLMPHEIVSKILGTYTISHAEEMVLDAQWKDLWKGVVDQIEAKEDGGVDFNPTRMVPMADVSGSMIGVPMHVSIALSIGISEITHPAFQNLVLTFDSVPTFHKLNATDTIVQKVRSLARAPWGMSTNFEAAYDLILDVAVRHNLKREDFPSLIVFSDMQFNEAVGSRSKQHVTTMHDVIHKKVKAVAHKLHWPDDSPSPIVYWNLRNTGGHPVDMDQEGAVLLAGFSPSLLKLVMEGDVLKEKEIEVVLADGTTVTQKIRVTPGEILRKMLDDKLYDPVRLILSSSGEGALADYQYVSTIDEKMETDDFEVV